jgi:hypothetical protein
VGILLAQVDLPEEWIITVYIYRIVTMVLSWDASEFTKCIKAIEKDKGGPRKEHLDAIKAHIQSSRVQFGAVRESSIKNSTSIITAIMESQQNDGEDLAGSLTEEQHQQCLEYYSALLAIRDRVRLTDSICRSVPDHFTQAIKDYIAAFEPLIRDIHNHVDLSEHVDAQQAFIDDMIKTGRLKKTSSPTGKKSVYRLPSVEDFVSLLHRNSGMLYKLYHHLVSKCPDITEEFRQWAKSALKDYQRDQGTGPQSMQEKLNEIFHKLPRNQKQPVLDALSEHSAYLASLKSMSAIRMQQVLDKTGEDRLCGPGIYLARWQSLLDETLITQKDKRGGVRYGRDVKHIRAQGKIGISDRKVCDEDENARKQAIDDMPVAPDTRIVVELMGESFKIAIQQSSAMF